jgi:hypothetical protein
MRTAFFIRPMQAEISGMGSTAAGTLVIIFGFIRLPQRRVR